MCRCVVKHFKCSLHIIRKQNDERGQMFDFCVYFKDFSIYCFFTTLHSFVRFFFLFALKFSKNCAACVARQLHQADYVNSLCVGNVVDVEMLDLSCALQSVAFHTRLSSLVSVKTLYIYTYNENYCGFYMYSSQNRQVTKTNSLNAFCLSRVYLVKM